MLSAREKDRYDRQLIMDSIGPEGQAKLKAARVFIAGAGGLGSPIAISLASAGVGFIRIVDQGLVELSNLNRQILYREADIDQAKALQAQKHLQELNSDIRIEGLEQTITADNVTGLAQGCDIIIDAMDNFATRYLLNQTAFELNIPLIHGAVEEFFGQVTTIIPGQTNCLQCLVPTEPPQKKWPVVNVSCGLVGALQAAEALKLILGIGSPLANRLLIVDGLNAHLEEIALEKSQDCPICG